MTQPFWKTKPLAEMNSEEWDSLCDGCALCCMNKIEDWDSGEIYYTNTACFLLDTSTCQCSDFANRKRKVPDCIQITSENVLEYNWLPDSCAYRKLANGEELDDWHPLVSGRPESVHEAGISLLGQMVPDDNHEDFFVFQLISSEE
jgi:uncharacterized cysteine cluster protein YcgN (CxxCxxCC family)